MCYLFCRLPTAARQCDEYIKKNENAGSGRDARIDGGLLVASAGVPTMTAKLERGPTSAVLANLPSFFGPSDQRARKPVKGRRSIVTQWRFAAQLGHGGLVGKSEPFVS